MPLIRRMEEMRDQLNLNIEKLYERAKVSSAQVKELELPQQLIYRRTYRSDNVADKTVLLRSTALEAMRAHGAYEELPAVGRQLLDYAKEHGLTPQGILRHTYLEGPPQHKDPAKFITQVILPIV